MIIFLSIMLHNLQRKVGDCESNFLVSKKDHVSVGYIPIGKPRVSPLRFLHEGTESAEVATSGIHTNTNTNVFISNQGPIKGKIITMIKYMDTLCNVYTPYNVTIK
jgi:hypothetical protein